MLVRAAHTGSAAVGIVHTRQTYQKQRTNRCGRLFINIETIERDAINTAQGELESPEPSRPQPHLPRGRAAWDRGYTVHWTADEKQRLRWHKPRLRSERTTRPAGSDRVCGVRSAALAVTSHTAFDSWRTRDRVAYGIRGGATGTGSERGSI
ncbi:jg2096 [Pararge aegeria aegeria]|uniref:Jg2096 protein n=1 Tax=Pararge aegeria aegeria TaxID=348720 RepID=A0A8S4QNS1_9NEOP|nr:jg2096 [Pararge aegeria aegeria]